MFEKLLAFLLHSKSAAISAIFVVGTTGALVSATTQNGVTTVTVTQASESPSASPSQATNAHNDKDEERSPSPSPATPNNAATKAAAEACQAQHKAAQAAFHEVNDTFHQLASDLAKAAQGKGEKGRDVLRTNVKKLKELRHAALKSIEATVTCDEDKDEDEDVDEDADDNARGNGREPEHMNNAKPAAVTFTGTDPKAIAEQAVAAMKLTFNTAKAEIDALPNVTPKENVRKESPERKHGDANTQHKSGEGQRDGD